MAKIPVTLHVEIPEGYEATGEYRVPKKGEHVLSRERSVALEADHVTSHYVILRKLELPTPPAGWELTGEYRDPKEGEWYAYLGTNVQAQFDFVDCPRWILCKAWQPPKWAPEGSWLFRLALSGNWYFTECQPRQDSYGKHWASVNHTVMLSAGVLAKLAGEEFTPPPVDCIQVKHQ